MRAEMTEDVVQCAAYSFCRQAYSVWCCGTRRDLTVLFLGGAACPSLPQKKESRAGQRSLWLGCCWNGKIMKQAKEISAKAIYFTLDFFVKQAIHSSIRYALNL